MRRLTDDQREARDVARYPNVRFFETHQEAVRASPPRVERGSTLPIAKWSTLWRRVFGKIAP